jgi:hypothetical protein
MMHLVATLLLQGVSLLADTAPVSGQPPGKPQLHQQIDTLVTASAPLGSIPLAGDAEFLRRASLDLLGVPPSPTEVQQFLAEAAPDKRERLIDRLLNDPRCERHLAQSLDLMLMERRRNIHIPQDDWLNYLLQAVREDRPWNEVAREILLANGQSGSRAAARFYLDRESEPNLITRDIGRIFLGKDLQCAQCHDHPLIDDYLQSDYHGLLAFVAPGFEQKLKQGDKEVAYYAEKAGTDLEFESVFFKGTRHLTGPLLIRSGELAEPFLLPGEEYEIPPGGDVLPVPRSSRRQQLATLLTDGECREFNENIANRLWTLLMGRGLVHPPDLHHSANPPSHPELLELLGREFAASGFRIRPFLKQLALTNVYQRAWEPPQDWNPAIELAEQRLVPLQSQLAELQSKLQSTDAALDAARSALAAAEAQLLPAIAELNTARNQYAELGKKVTEAAKALAEATAQLATKEMQAVRLKAIAEQAQQGAGLIAGDQELAAAAQKFVEKAAQLASELEPLRQAAADKLSAHTAATEAQQAALPVIHAAQAKVEPLRAEFRRLEREFTAARLASAAAQIASRNTEAQFVLARKTLELAEQSKQLVARSAAIPQLELALTTARQAATDYLPVIKQAEDQLQQMQQAYQSVMTNLEQARAAESLQQERVALVAHALQGTQLALAQLPEDALLVEAGAKLQQRVGELQAVVSQQAQAVATATAEVEQAARQVASANQAMEAARAEQQQREQSVAQTDASLQAARSESESLRSQAAESELHLTEEWSKAAWLSPLRPLTPEQLCWSIFAVTGVYERYLQAERAELDKSAPLSEADQANPVVMQQRNRELEQRTFDKLKGNLPVFISIYGHGAGQPQGDFFATVDQALFAANGGSILSWVSPAGGNVTERAIQQAEPQAVAQELYLGVLSRFPDDSEVAAVRSYLEARADQKPAAVQELVWGLLSSAEFRFNR